MNKIAEQVDVNVVSRISAGTTVVGDVYSEGDIRVDGNVNGSLCTRGKIVVGEQARIEGVIACTTCDFLGELNGDFYTRDVLSLKGSSSVSGSIHVSKLEVEMGTSVNGSCKMISEDEFDRFFDDLVGKIVNPKKAK